MLSVTKKRDFRTYIAICAGFFILSKKSQEAKFRNYQFFERTSERVAAKGIFEKNIVLGMLERDKEVRGFVIDEAKRDKIMAKIYENVKLGSEIITDEQKAYYWLYSQFKHQVVNHSKGE